MKEILTNSKEKENALTEYTVNILIKARTPNDTIESRDNLSRLTRKVNAEQ